MDRKTALYVNLLVATVTAGIAAMSAFAIVGASAVLPAALAVAVATLATAYLPD